MFITTYRPIRICLLQTKNILGAEFHLRRYEQKNVKKFGLRFQFLDDGVSQNLKNRTYFIKANNSGFVFFALMGTTG